jgi:large subunit ribosomal protein L14
MIQVQSWLKTIDNSGARFVECIKTLGGFNRKTAYPGDFILVSIKQLRLIRKVKVGQIHLALITRTRKSTIFIDGTSSSSENNIVLLINRKKRVLGTRFFGWVSRNLRRKKLLRLLCLSGCKVILIPYAYYTI